MKTKLLLTALALTLVTFNLQPSTARAQGSLTPSGPPAPTMKSLDQIEPRTPISSLPYTISNPGSYYVTTNLTGVSGFDGIDIATNNVTLDLNGFTLQGVAGSLNGINVVNPARNLAIRNGALDAWGDNGVSGINAYNSQLERLCTSSSGGLVAGSNCIVSLCSAIRNTVGIEVGNNSVVKDCTASYNLNEGITAGDNSILMDCVANINNDSPLTAGMSVGNNSTIKDCINIGNGEGIYAPGDNSIVKDCIVSSNLLYGILIKGNNSTVNSCSANGNGNYGIYVLNSNCEVVGNSCSGNGNYGIYIFGSQNRVDNNSVGNNSSYGVPRRL